LVTPSQRAAVFFIACFAKGGRETERRLSKNAALRRGGERREKE